MCGVWCYLVVVVVYSMLQDWGQATLQLGLRNRLLFDRRVFRDGAACWCYLLILWYPRH